MQFQQAPQLVIFDKDGTLIDFQAMWGSWAIGFIARMRSAVAPDIEHQLFDLFGVDPRSHRIHPAGALAIAPEAATQDRIVVLLAAYGYAPAAARAMVTDLWQAPDPATTAVPCADVVGLCGWILRHGAKIAVATADNRIPTVATMQALGIADAISFYACADDVGIAPKPAPDKILAICAALAIEPRHAIMVGDTPADMQMGRAAQVMHCVAVTTGVSTSSELAGHADIVLGTIAGLPGLWPNSPS
jgi:phosphoglycolate phosphatase-like HAD superfamily hydrolase